MKERKIASAFQLTFDLIRPHGYGSIMENDHFIYKIATKIYKKKKTKLKK